MGRKPTAHLNMPPGMRPRKQKSGNTFYYLDTGGRPRKEIPLGDDYILALRKYAEYLDMPKSKAVTFTDVIERYKRDVLNTLAKSTIATHKSDLKHIEEKFKDAPLTRIRPMNIREFLTIHADKPTTANRCKRLFSTLWNHARGWGYTDAENPCAGIMGHAVGRREVYVTDAVYDAVYEHASEQLREALDFAYLTGQRPGDSLKTSIDDIADGMLIVDQGKTGKKLRIAVTGELAALIDRIRRRKDEHKTHCSQLLMNRDGMPLTKQVLRDHFKKAKEVAAQDQPELASQIAAFWFYDLRAKAADDTSDQRGEQAASDLLGHDSVKTTRRHYLRRGKIVAPTK